MSAWPQMCLGEVCAVVAGQSPEGTAYNNRGEGLPFYQGKKEFTDRYLAPPSTWTTSITKRALPDDILMSVRAPVGPINIARQEICIGRGLAAIRANSKIDNGFLWYALLWLQPTIVGNAGAVFPSINKKQIEALTLPLPSLEVQKRIVAMLDQAFAALDRVRALAEANLTDLEHLSESASRAVFDGVGGDWLKVGDLCEIYQPKTISAKDLKPDGAYIVFGANGPIGRYDKFNHEAPQLLVTCRGATCGSVNISEPFSWITGNAMVVRPKDGRISVGYLEQFFRGAMDWSKVITGAAQPQITRQSLAPTLVPVPDRVTQDQQATALKDLRGKLSRTENRIKAKLDDVASLRQSFLQRAFARELT